MAKGARVRDDEKDGARQAWATPRALFEALHREYAFTVDACADASNAKLPRYWTREQDGLVQRWEGERLFCNPPYNEIAPWVERAWLAHERDPATVVALLLPARTGAGWFADFALDAALHWFRGRIQFEPPPGVKPSSNAEDSILVVFGVDEIGPSVRDARTGERMERARLGLTEPLPLAPTVPPCPLCGLDGGPRVSSALVGASVHEPCVDSLLVLLDGMDDATKQEAIAMLRG